MYEVFVIGNTVVIGVRLLQSGLTWVCILLELIYLKNRFALDTLLSANPFCILALVLYVTKL